MTVQCPSPSRRYIFAEHAPGGYQQRCARHQSTPAAADGTVPTFGKIVEAENLLRVFKRLRESGGQAPGRDGLSYDDFSITEIGAALRQVSLAIREGTYRPHRSRVLHIPRPGHRPRRLDLRVIIDRVVSAAITEALTPAIEPLFVDQSYGFRPGKCVHQMLAHLEWTAIQRDHWVIAQDDIASAFPSVPVELALDAYRQHIQDPALLRLIEVVLRGHEALLRTTGLDQGDPLSPLTLNLLLHHVLDLPLTAAGPDIPLWLRYADNLVYLCLSVSDGNRAIERAIQLLRPYGLRPKGEDGPPADLRRQGAHIMVLGFRISRSTVGLRFGISPKSWNGLRETLGMAHRLPNPSLHVSGIVHGWLGAQGPAIENDGERSILERIYSICAQSGFREVSAEYSLTETMGAAREHWGHVREGVRRDHE